MLDLLIKNGTYPDFKDKRLKKGNIGIANGKIAYIGIETPLARKEVNAAGKVVSPGFIDIHMHEEDFVNEGEEYIVSNMMLHMGVTTAVGGNCGVQRQPVAIFRDVIERKGGSPINYMLQTGYNTYRTQLGIGRYEIATEEQRNEIRKYLKKDLEDGAIGISFGIEYDPGITTEEILYAIGVSDNPKLIVSAHYRDECTHDIHPVEEMITIAKQIPMKFQISHLSSCSATGRMTEALVAINKAMEENPRLNYDTYPYNAFSTSLGSSVFEDGCLEVWGKDYRDILLTDNPYKNVRCTKEIFEKAREEYPDMLAVAFVMNEDEIAEAIANPRGMIASDAIINNGKGHPRAAGTFPRVLGKYVREEKVISLIDALRKMTLEPAKVLGLDEKGRIEIGCDGDITIFDPDTIIDKATFLELNLAPEGIDRVLLAGKVAMERNKIINSGLGKFIPLKG